MRGRVVLALGLIAAAPPLMTGFPDIPPVASRELAMRIATPADAARLERRELIAPQLSIDPAAERFFVAVPHAMPAAGYGLFVYVSPSDAPDLPDGWAGVIGHAGMIAVSAANAGNRQGAFTRRMPLALIAAQGVMRRYKVDPSRVVIAGFSGGSRVALRLALAYPELFRGALLDAGSDVLGTAELPRPDDVRLALLRQNRFALVSGSNDSAAATDARAAAALRAAGVTQLAVREVDNLGHDPMPARDLRNALNFIGKTAPPPKEAAR